MIRDESMCMYVCQLVGYIGGLMHARRCEVYHMIEGYGIDSLSYDKGLCDRATHKTTKGHGISALRHQSYERPMGQDIR